MRTTGIAAAISLGLSSLSLLARGVSSSPDRDYDAIDDGDAPARRLSLPLISSDAEPAEHERPDDPKLYDYLIVQYHKTGHAISHALTNIIKDDHRAKFNTVRLNPLLKRDHDPQTGCDHFNLQLGMMYVQAGPDFYCDVDVLAGEMLKGKGTKRGIKIVHLVRDPFPLTVSHFKYHEQSPTPEAWVKKFDVCRQEESGGKEYLDLTLPTLMAEGVATYEDYEKVLEICHSLFRARPGIRGNFYAHLRGLEPTEGLELAATNLLRGKGGDLTRMATNIIKLRRLQRLEEKIIISQHQLETQRRIQVLTVKMEDFNREPRDTARRFFDFILGGSVSAETKEELAGRYEEEYRATVASGTSHVTHGDDKKTLEEHLRNHEFFGRVLGNIARVVDSAVEESA